MFAVAAVEKLGTPICMRALRDLPGGRLSETGAVRKTHGRGEAFHVDMLPAAVASPVTTEETSVIVARCARRGVPVVPSGAGTSLADYVSAPCM